MRHSLLLLAALSSLVVSSCKKDGETAASSSPSATSASTPSSTAADPGAHGPPVVVRVTGTVDGASESDITIEIEVRTGIAVPAALRVVLPAGATSTGSALIDSVDVSKPGTQKRQLHVKSTAPLAEAAPVVVTLEARDMDAGTGFHAERQWPPRNEGSVGHGGPRPPGGRPSPSAPTP